MNKAPCLFWSEPRQHRDTTQRGLPQGTPQTAQGAATINSSFQDTISLEPPKVLCLEGPLYFAVRGQAPGPCFYLEHQPCCALTRSHSAASLLPTHRSPCHPWTEGVSIHVGLATGDTTLKAKNLTWRCIYLVRTGLERFGDCSPFFCSLFIRRGDLYLKKDIGQVKLGP